jgi:hypothetical protein
MCDWVILNNQAELANADSPDETISGATSFIDGQLLTKPPVFDSMSKGWRFVFDLGGELIVRPYDDCPQSEQWMLYEPNGYVLSADQVGDLMHECGDTKPNVRRSRHH